MSGRATRAARDRKPLTAEQQRIRQLETENRQLRGDVNLLKKHRPSLPEHSHESSFVPAVVGCYLAVVLDLYSRKVVGWAMDAEITGALVCSALQLAITQRQPQPDLIVHTDRGSQYASSTYRALMGKHQLVGNMSRKGNCWDNAVMERFFLKLKMERVWQSDYAKHAETMTDIADHIVGFYNSVRLHSKLDNLHPMLSRNKRQLTTYNCL